MSETNPTVLGFDAVTPKGITRVRRLCVGETVREGDFYLSTTGNWQPAPICGHEIIDNGVEWARPLALEIS